LFFIKSVFIDHVNQKISLDVYQVLLPGKDLPAMTWIRDGLEGSKDETLTLTTFNSAGDSLYQYIFSGLTYRSHTVSFDYSSPKETYDKVTVKYEKSDYTRIFQNGVENEDQNEVRQ
jgi:hypothetical protein